MGMQRFKALFDAFEGAGHELWFVGGFVRDLLDARWQDNLDECNRKHFEQFGGQKPPPKFFLEAERFWDAVDSGEKDVDFATSAKPEESVKICEKIGLTTWPIGIEFGTIQAKLGDLKVEITTFRCEESYKKGSRKPSVKFGKTIKEDLARRDFTINAMAMNMKGEVCDPFGGQHDLVEGGIWTPLNAHTSFEDDPLRMLRACRFCARGRFLGWQTGTAMESLKHKIHDISKERVFEEVTKILMSWEPTRGFEVMIKTGLFAEVFPELQAVVDFKTKKQSKDLWPHTAQVVEQTPKDPVLRWAALFHDVGKPHTVREKGKVSFHGHEAKGAEIWNGVADRLKVSNKFKEQVGMVIGESGNFTSITNNRFVSVTDTAVRRFIRKVGVDHLENIFKFTLADMTTKNERKKARQQRALRRLKERMDELIEKDNVAEIKLPKGTGHILMDSLGLKGKMLGDMMQQLTQKLVDGELPVDANFAAEAAKIINSDQQKWAPKRWAKAQESKNA